jgi:hypothetical protein
MGVRFVLCSCIFMCSLHVDTFFLLFKFVVEINLKTKRFPPPHFFFNCWRSTNITQMCTGDNPPLANTLRGLFTLVGLEKHLHILRWWEPPSGCPCTSLLSRHISSEIYSKSAPTVGLAAHVRFLLLVGAPVLTRVAAIIMATFQSKSFASLCVLANGEAKRTELKSAGEE